MAKETDNKFDVLVLGAGIIGVSSVWHLQSRGQKAALLDRAQPGRGASFGNAGLIERSSIVPYHFPRHLGDVLRYATNRQSAMRYDVSYLPKIAAWLYQFWRHSSPQNLAKATAALLPLIEQSVSEHDVMIKAAGLQPLRGTGGWIEIFREKRGFEQAKSELAELTPYQLQADVLDSAALREREPSLLRSRPQASAGALRDALAGCTPLKNGLAGAIHWLDPHTITAPGALVEGYCQHFIAQGGCFFHGDARSLTRKGETLWQVETQDGVIEAKNIVIALGWESGALIKKLTGKSLPLAVKRGYHMHYQQEPEQNLNHPLCDAQAGFVLAPMQQGLRLTTGIEFAAPTAAPNEIQLRRCEKIARQYCNLGKRIDEIIWLGRRPCLPDMRPIISPIGERSAGLWANFGHAHHGLTLGPVSGRLLSEMMMGQEPFTNPTPFSIKRFH